MPLTSFTPEQRLAVLAHWSATLERSVEARLNADWLAQSTPVRTTSVGSGFSGGVVFRVELAKSARSSGKVEPQPSWALKAWPSSTSAAKITRIASIVRAAAKHSRLLAPPLMRADTNSTLLSEHGRFWEMTRWIPGTPLPADASEAAIASGGEAIASVHTAMNSSDRLVSRPAASSVPRCITDRITRLQQLTPLIDVVARQIPARDKLAERLAGQLTGEQPRDQTSMFHCSELAKLMIRGSALLARQWPQITPQLVERLRQHARDHEKWASCWVLRDVHREHILVSGKDVVQGILDYDAVEWDSPASDLARWAGDFDATTLSIAEIARPTARSPLDAAVAGYRRIRPFPNKEVDLAQTLIDVNRACGLANWLVWLIAENRQFAVSAQKIQGRISHLIALNCRIC